MRKNKKLKQSAFISGHHHLMGAGPDVFTFSDLQCSDSFSKVCRSHLHFNYISHKFYTTMALVFYNKMEQSLNEGTSTAMVRAKHPPQTKKPPTSLYAKYVLYEHECLASKTGKKECSIHNSYYSYYSQSQWLAKFRTSYPNLYFQRESYFLLILEKTTVTQLQIGNEMHLHIQARQPPSIAQHRMSG